MDCFYFDGSVTPKILQSVQHEYPPFYGSSDLVVVGPAESPLELNPLYHSKGQHNAQINNAFNVEEEETFESIGKSSEDGFLKESP